MARLAGLVAAALVLLTIAAAIVGHWRERALYEQLAHHNQRGASDSEVIEHRSIGSRHDWCIAC
jgi:hypothetical protein